MTTRREILASALSMAGAATFGMKPAWASAGTIKVGIIAEVTGPFAEFGYQFLTAIRAYMRRHGDTVAGKAVQIIVRDVGGPNPDVAKRLAQELVVREGVDFLAGFGFSPNASAAASVATKAKVPMIVMNAQALGIPAQSPYIVRTSTNATESAIALGHWLADQGISNVSTLVMDYSPGHDAEKGFSEAFTHKGGTIRESIRVPLGSVEFAPYLQRVKDSKPEALFAFTNGGSSGVAFLRAVRDRGLAESGIKVYGTGDTTFEPILDAAGDAALGIITAYPYSPAHQSVQNEQFVEDFFAEGDGKQFPSIFAVSAHDGMAAIYEVIRRLDGDIDGDKAMEVLKGLRLDSPRGPFEIDSVTRDARQLIYMRKTELRDGRVMNIEFDQLGSH